MEAAVAVGGATAVGVGTTGGGVAAPVVGVVTGVTTGELMGVLAGTGLTTLVAGGAVGTRTAVGVAVDGLGGAGAGTPLFWGAGMTLGTSGPCVSCGPENGVGRGTGELALGVTATVAVAVATKAAGAAGGVGRSSTVGSTTAGGLRACASSSASTRRSRMVLPSPSR